MLTLDVSGLSPDEAMLVIEAAAEVRDALLAGLPKYGHMRILEDPRDWDREEAEERRDLNVYRLAAKIRRRVAGR